MVKTRRSIDIGDSTDFLRAVEEAVRTNEPLVIRQKNVTVAILRPLKQSPGARQPRNRPTDKSDSYWNIVGMADGPDDGVHDVSHHKHQYLVEAYEHGVTRE